GNRAAAHGDRRESRRSERAGRPRADRARTGRRRGAGRVRQHQPRPGARRRQLPQDPAPVMPIRYSTIATAVLVFIVATVLVRIARLIVARVLGALETVGQETRAAVPARARQLTRALTVLAYGVAALASISLVLERVGMSEPQWNPRSLLHWLFGHGI